jgi:hypothetical protein
MQKRTAEHGTSAMTQAPQVDDRTRRANRRLAIILGLVALGFYLIMLYFSPQTS